MFGLTALYNRLRSILPKEEENITTQVSLEALALAELVAYIEDQRCKANSFQAG